MAISYVSIPTRLGELFLSTTERGICIMRLTLLEEVK